MKWDDIMRQEGIQKGWEIGCEISWDKMWWHDMNLCEKVWGKIRWYKWMPDDMRHNEMTKTIWGHVKVYDRNAFIWYDTM